MKKSLLKIVYVLFILFPIIIYAEGIENFYINATLEENGNLRVREYFNLEGTYNGFQRIVEFKNTDAYEFKPELEAYGGSELHNGSNIILNEIRAVNVDSNFDFNNVQGDIFTSVGSANKGDYGVYIMTSNYSGYTYTIYLPSSKGKSFYLDYTITNIAILHEDVGELGWNIFTKMQEDIENLSITINFPNNKEELRVWAHGPLNGNVSSKNNNTLIAKIKNLSAYKSVDVRATFDKEVIQLSNKKTGVNALSKILNYEENQAAQANYERQQQEYKNQTAAQEKIWECNNTLNRTCYNEAVRLVNLVTTKEKKEYYLSQLEELDLRITEIEERNAKDKVEQAERYLDYTMYKNAYLSSAKLTNKELQNELLNRLQIVKDKITQKEQEQYEKYKLYLISTTIVVIIIIIYIYYFHDREYRVSFNAPYLREIPNHYSPSTVDYLFKRKITNKAISAEIMNLINKKIILCEKTQDKKEDYIIKRNKDYKGNLSEKETAIVELLLNKEDNAKLSDIKKKASSSYRSFIKRWDKVIEKCTKEAIAEDIYIDDKQSKYKKKTGRKAFEIIIIIIFFLMLQTIILTIPAIIMMFLITTKSKPNEQNLEIKKSTSKVVSILVLIILMVGTIISIIYYSINLEIIKINYWLPISVILLIIVALIYACSCKKRTQTGANEYSRWKAFKRFLLDFGKMDIKEVGEVKLWKEYLVYATVLDCADKVEKAMKIKVKEIPNTDNDSIFTDIHISYIMSDSINKGIRESYSNAVAKSASSSSGSSGGSSWSSGSGGGGGFSSGGGSFGGGGGGGRF
ncbi:MAG: DUF2207 family protein [Candidatus Coprovivens sp.]